MAELLLALWEMFSGRARERGRVGSPSGRMDCHRGLHISQRVAIGLISVMAHMSRI